MDDADRVSRFRRQVEQELLPRRLLQAGFTAGMTVTWGRGDGLRVEVVRADEEDWRAYLLAFRPFIDRAEPLSLAKTWRSLCRSVTDAGLLDELAQWRRAWLRIERDRTIGVGNLGVPATAGAFARRWINPRYFHHDPGARDQFARLPEEAQAMLDWWMRNYVVAMTEIIGGLYGFILRAERAAA